MYRIIYPVVLLLSLGHVEEATANILSDLVDKLLNGLNKNISIPEITLGKESNKFSNVSICLPEDLYKKVKGVGSLGVEVNMNLSKVAATGFYDLEHIDIPGLFPIYGKGNFKVDMFDTNFKLQVRVTKDFVTEKYDIKIPVFNFYNQITKVDFENLMNDPYLADFLNELISSLIPEFLVAFHKRIIEVLDPFIQHFGNGIIYCVIQEFDRLEECIRNIPLPKELEWRNLTPLE